jgi:hypothetical protein
VDSILLANDRAKWMALLNMELNSGWKNADNLFPV